MEKTRYVALTTDGAHAGEEVQARTYPTAEHAQLANPLGRVYVGTLIAEADYDLRGDAGRERVKIEAQVEYPLTLQSVRVAGLGMQAEGVWMLRDLGHRAHMRWAIQYRNDQNGGVGDSDYWDDYAEACAAFAKRATKTLAENATKAAYYTKAA